jgi:hypothetical protein
MAEMKLNSIISPMRPAATNSLHKRGLGDLLLSDVILLDVGILDVHVEQHQVLSGIPRNQASQA